MPRNFGYPISTKVKLTGAQQSSDRTGRLSLFFFKNEIIETLCVDFNLLEPGGTFMSNSSSQQSGATIPAWSRLCLLLHSVARHDRPDFERTARPRGAGRDRSVVSAKWACIRRAGDAVTGGGAIAATSAAHRRCPRSSLIAQTEILAS
jgi:hypothetical protein